MLRTIKFFYSIVIAATILISNYVITAQSLMGYNGLFRIPTASKNTDGEVVLGLSFLDKNIAILENGFSNNLRTIVSINYLPFLEVNLVLNNLIASNSPGQAVGDRQASFKLLLTDLGNFPNIAFGLYDPLGSLEKGGVNSDFWYITSSKNLSVFKEIAIELSLGYANSLYNRRDIGLKGVFGGLCIKLFKNIEVFGEYDSKYYNAGTRINVFNHLMLLGGINQLKYFSGGINYYFNL